MKLLPKFFAVGLTTTLAACGEGGIRSIVESPLLPPQSPVHARQAPIVDLDGSLHIGADVAPTAEALPNIAMHGDAGISHGMSRDGVAAAEILAYLEADALTYGGADEAETPDASVFPDGLVIRFAALPPTVRVAEGTPVALIDETVRVVQAINAALPQGWQLGFDSEPLPAGTTALTDGEILVTFARQADWLAEAASPTEEDIGLAEPQYEITLTGDPEIPWGIEIVAGRVWVDSTLTEGRERLGVIAHELIHLLGRNHVDPARFPETIMVAGGSEQLTPHILHPLDREALLAMYGRLGPVLSPAHLAEELGPWSDTSLHVRGALGIANTEIAWGAALRNELVQPWATGPTPDLNLEDNTALSRDVRWEGRLLGLTPNAETVAGATQLTIDLPTLSGSLDFSELEQWPADSAPGPTGSGVAWREGRLSYRIGVQGITFTQTGGDAGFVTGAFFGPSHEGMGGVLVRDDLSAGFGGRR